VLFARHRRRVEDLGGHDAGPEDREMLPWERTGPRSGDEKGCGRRGVVEVIDSAVVAVVGVG